MNLAQKRYYAVNQLLCGKKFTDLPSDIQEIVSAHQQTWNSLLKIKVEKLSKVERVFVNLLRVPFYNIYSTKSKQVILLENIIALVRHGDATADACADWASASISDVRRIDIGSLAIKDGVLYIPDTDEYRGMDFSAAMRVAFTIRCWGASVPTPELMRLVNTLVQVATPKGDITISDKFIANLFDEFTVAAINPQWLASTALYVNNLEPCVKELNGLCWWRNFDMDTVAALLPRGKGDTLANAVIPATEFFKLIESSASALEGMRVQGSRIVFGDK